MKRIVPLFCLFFCLLCGIPCAAAPAGKLHNAGFRTIGIWQQEQQLRLDINVWYPTARRPADLNYSPWTLHAARNAPPREGRFPVILLSHATAGTRFSYHELAAWLARNGFVVAAPTHPGDNMDDMHALYTLEQLSGRVHHLRTTLDILAGDAQLGPVLDLDRVGVAGFQAGATAALLMGGAGLDAAARLNTTVFKRLTLFFPATLPIPFTFPFSNHAYFIAFFYDGNVTASREYCKLKSIQQTDCCTAYCRIRLAPADFHEFPAR